MKEGHNDARIVPPQSAAHPRPAHTTFRSTLELSMNLHEVAQCPEKEGRKCSQALSTGRP